jgi:hypothetical protein
MVVPLLRRIAGAKDDDIRRRRRITDDRNMGHIVLVPCEMRWPLLQEGPYTFLMILGLPS